MMATPRSTQQHCSGGGGVDDGKLVLDEVVVVEEEVVVVVTHAERHAAAPHCGGDALYHYAPQRKKCRGAGGAGAMEVERLAVADGSGLLTRSDEARARLNGGIEGQ